MTPSSTPTFDINTDDEELQADYTRDFLTLAYSHPTVVGVQLWGFWERSHWKPEAARPSGSKPRRANSQSALPPVSATSFL
jgi:hypothetical protein